VEAASPLDVAIRLGVVGRPDVGDVDVVGDVALAEGGFFLIDPAHRAA
jgi:hypothetical protein